MDLLLDAALRATVILLVAGAVTLPLRRAPAAARHLVWTLAFAGLMAAPIASALLPAWPTTLMPQVPPVAVVLPASPGPDRPVAPLGATRPAAPRPAIVAVATAPRALDWRGIAGAVWATGAALILGALLVGLVRVRVLARRATPVTAERWAQLVDDLSREIGLTRPVRLLRAAGPAMPMTWGVWRPAILIPADADAWSAERRRQVLLHELAHVRRHDVLTQLVARLACAAYWFHPLVWLAAARLRIERERACDDLVLRSGARPSDYAGNLLEIARSLRLAPAAGLASVAMARPSQLATRLLDVLDEHRRRGAVTLRTAIRGTLATAAVVFPLAAARPAEPRPERPITSAADLETLPRNVRATLARGPVRVAVSDSIIDCEGAEPRRRGTSVHVNDGTAVHLTYGRCDLTFKAEGNFTFTEDFTDIATVARNGEVVIEVDDGRTFRRIVIRPGAGGRLERAYTVDREARPYDAAARAWLGEALTLLLRRSGLAAEERAQWILNRRGIEALVEEIALVAGDYSRRKYYDAALASGKLDARATERLVARAGAEIKSDYELAELLIGVATRQGLTAGLQAEFVTAARSIQSDYESRRVLEAALRHRDLSPQTANAMLAAAAEIRSDYELAELLIAIHRARPIDEAVREAFFAAATTLQSDYELRRVMSAVTEAGAVSPAMLGSLLEAAASIRSDYELTELLLQTAQLQTMSGALAQPFLTAARTIQSDYEAGRALRRLAARRDLAPAALRELLEAAATIQSDHELAELLIDVARVHRIDAGLRPAFDRALATIGSTYDRDRVQAAVGRGPGRAELE